MTEAHSASLAPLLLIQGMCKGEGAEISFQSTQLGPYDPVLEAESELISEFSVTGYHWNLSFLSSTNWGSVQGFLYTPTEHYPCMYSFPLCEDSQAFFLFWETQCEPLWAAPADGWVLDSEPPVWKLCGCTYSHITEEQTERKETWDRRVGPLCSPFGPKLYYILATLGSLGLQESKVGRTAKLL